MIDWRAYPKAKEPLERMSSGSWRGRALHTYEDNDKSHSNKKEVNGVVLDQKSPLIAAPSLSG